MAASKRAMNPAELRCLLSTLKMLPVEGMTRSAYLSLAASVIWVRMLYTMQVDSEEEEELYRDHSDRGCPAQSHDSIYHRSTGSMTDTDFSDKVCSRQPQADLHMPSKHE